MQSDNQKNFRVSGIPLGYTKRDVRELIMSVLSVEPAASVEVHSLAINPVRRNSKVATISFRALPVCLSEGSKHQWKFALPSEGDEDTVTTLILDTHFTGFTPLQDSDEDKCDVDVIALSGLGGHAFGSFKERGGTFMWLRDALPSDFPNARILIYGYDTQTVRSSSFQNLTDLGKKLRTGMKGIRQDSQSRPILFIGHSLGGLVIKEAICKLKEGMDEDDASILNSVFGFVFFGVPHLGMDTGSLVPLVKDQPNRGLLESLRNNSALLVRLERDFRSAFNGRHIDVVSFYETKESPTAVEVRPDQWEYSGPLEVLVHVPSATCGSEHQHQHPIDRSHTEMVKYSNYYDETYTDVRTVLQPVLLKARSMRATVSVEAGNNTLLPHSTKSIVAGESHFCAPFGRNRDFVGRESILAQLLATIPPNEEVDDCQRTAIVGLGGVGKTQIALEAAFRVRDQHSGCSIFWVPAVDATSFENAYREIGRQLGVKGIDEDKADVKTLVKEALSRESSGHWLLIIDNADDPDLLFGDTALSDCLPFSLKGSVLFTTRRHEVAVRLDIPQRNIVTTEEMSEPEAMDLLLKGLNHHGSDLEDVRSLVIFLEKLPLAIKQASAYIAKTRISVAKYLDHCKSSDKTLIKLLSKDFEDRGRYKGTRNPVATTWLISFEHITRDNPVAARYLKFICFLAEKEIPVSLLPPASDELEADEAIGFLKAYAFITNRESHDSFDMHRLVRLATRNWLDEKGKHEECVTEVIQRLEQAFPVPQIANRDTWIKYLPHLEAALESQEGAPDEAALDLLLTTAGCYFNLGRYQKSEQKWRQVVELQEKLLGKEHPQTLRSMGYIAKAMQLQGKYEEAETRYRQTAELMQKALGKDSPDTLNCMGNFGGLLVTLGKYEEAEQMLRQTLDLQVKVLDKDDTDISYSMHSLAALLIERGKQEEAEGLCRQALAQNKNVHGEEEAGTLSCMALLGQLLMAQGKYEEAEGVIRQTMDMREKLLGKDHPETLRTMSDLAGVLNSKGNLMEAEGLCRRALELMRDVVDEGHVHTLTTMNTLASVLISQGEFEEAEGMLRRTVELWEKALGEDHLGTLKNMSQLACVLMTKEDVMEAEGLCRRALELMRNVLGEEHPDTLIIMNTFAAVLINQGEYEEAEGMLRRTVELREKVLGKEHPLTLVSLSILATVLKKQGKRENAVALMEKCYQFFVQKFGGDHQLARFCFTYLNDWKLEG